MDNPITTILLVSILLVTSFTCMGMLALWAATSPRHWLLRSVVVLVVLSPLLLIPAYHPWIPLALQGCTVAAGVTIWRWRATRRQEGSDSESAGTSRRRFKLRFSIRTLLAMACLVALVTPIIVAAARESTPASSWMAFAFSGLCGGAAVLIGAWMGTAQRKWLAWLTASLLCLGLASAAAWFDLWFGIFVFSFPETPAALAWFAVIPVLAAMTWLLIRMWFAGGATIVGTFARARQIAARSFFCLLLAAFAFPPAYVTWQLTHPLRVPDLPVPQPNGIDDIVAAGKAFGASPILSGSVEPKSTAELAAEIAKHAGDYQRLRIGLGRDIQAWVWAKDGKVLDSVVLGSSAIHDARQAARGLMRESQLAQQQKRYGDAARIALDNVHLGQAVTRDGLLVDYLWGVATESMGNESLYQVLPQLNADECRETIAALVEADRRREPVNDALHRERACSENTLGWHFHFNVLLKRLASTDHRESMLGLRDREEAKTRLLITELALRACQLEHGALPDRLERLTPEILAELPVDPYNSDGHPLRYVRTDDGHVLYSIGCDGNDDDGRPPARNPSGSYELESDGDLRLDVFFSRDDDVGDTEPKD